MVLEFCVDEGLVNVILEVELYFSQVVVYFKEVSFLVVLYVFVELF